MKDGNYDLDSILGVMSFLVMVLCWAFVAVLATSLVGIYLIVEYIIYASYKAVKSLLPSSPA